MESHWISGGASTQTHRTKDMKGIRGYIGLCIFPQITTETNLVDTVAKSR